MIVREQDGVRVVLADRLPPEVAAKAQALYARISASMEEHLRGVRGEQRAQILEVLREHCLVGDGHADDDPVVADLQALMEADGSSAAKFVSQWYTNYGHASIGDCAVGAVLGIEGFSELACKAFQHWPLFSGQQTSTRAVDVSKARIVDPLGTPASKAVLDRWMAFHTGSQEAVAAEVRRRYPRNEGVLCRTCNGAGSHYRDMSLATVSCTACGGVGRVGAETEKAYDGAVKYRTFDVLRGFLPAGLTTQTSLAMNLRQLSDHLTWLLVHPLKEVRRVATLVQGTLRERYPASGSFGGSAALSGVGTKGTTPEAAAARDVWHRVVAEKWTYQDPIARPGRRQSLDNLAASSEFSSAVDVDAIRYLYADVFQGRPRGCVLPRFLDDLGTCTATFLLDWGGWRDIDRQRALAGRVPLLTTKYGFEPWYLDQLPLWLVAEADALFLRQEEAIRNLTDDPLLQQYYTPFGYRVPTTLTGTLPVWAYVLELRTGPTVHPTLRRAMLDVWAKFRATFGDLVPLHVNDSPDAISLRRGQQTIEKRS